MAVLLKGFDKDFRKADETLDKLGHRIFLERNFPDVWTKKQVEDLMLIQSAMVSLFNAISQMANQVRDD
jgi:hypothetical protein